MTPGVRRLLSPAWILSHLLVVGLLVATVNLGFWQLRRLETRRAYNAVVDARAGQPVVPLAEALDSFEDGATPDDLRYVRVQVSGKWEPGAEVHLANRSREGVAGVHVVALLRIDDIHPGLGVTVDRGFVPRSLYLAGDRSAWAPALGELVMVGTLDVGRLGERGHADEVDRIDLDALAERWGVPLAPMWIRESASSGVDGSIVWPAPVSVADLGDGSHLSYAVQWFVFTLIGLGGYPLVLVRLARRDPGVA